MAKRTKQILRNNNKEQKQISLNGNTIRSPKRKAIFQNQENAKDLNEPCDLGSKRSQMKIKQKNWIAWIAQ